MSKSIHYLCLSLSGIGNYLMHTPFIHALKSSHPHASITLWVAPRHTVSLAQANPDIDHVIKAPIKRSLLGHARQILRLRRLSATTGIILYPGQHWKGALYLTLAGTKRRLGHTYHHLGNPSSPFLLTHAIPVRPALHDIDQNLALLSALSIPVPPSPQPYHLSVPAYHQRRGAVLLRQLQPRTKYADFYVGLHPGSAPNFSWKRWPISYYACLSKQLIKQYHAYILLFGGPAELRLMKNFRRLIGHKHAAIISAHLLTVAAVIKHCQVFIANDSGLMHLASALSVPTIGLFGPTDERRTGPRGAHGLALRAPSSVPVYDVNLNFDLGSDPHPTLLALTPDLVMAKVTTLLSSRL